MISGWRIKHLLVAWTIEIETVFLLLKLTITKNMKNKNMIISRKKVTILLFLSFSFIIAHSKKKIKHVFLAVDESRSQLHYVNQFEPEKDWTISLPAKYRDIHLLQNKTILLSTKNGYALYDFNTHQKLKEVNEQKFFGTQSVIPTANNTKIIGCIQTKMLQGKKSKGVAIYELDSNDKVSREVFFKGYKTLRLLRLSQDGSFLFGDDEKVVKAAWDGASQEFALSDQKMHIYEILESSKDQQHYIVSTGYGGTLEEWSKEGGFIRKIAGNTAQEKKYYYFADAQKLSSSTWGVCNWTGHHAQDSHKAPQLFEFDEKGKIVWQWHDPKKAGTIHGVCFIE